MPRSIGAQPKPNSSGEHQPGEPADDRHEAAAAEEREIVRQLDVAVAVVERAGDQPGEDAERARSSLASSLRARRRRRDRRAAGEDRRSASGGTCEQRLGALGGDQEADDAGEARRAVVLAREADRRRRSRTAGRDWRRSRRRPRRRTAMLSRSGWPRRSSSPATGSTAIGSISARPSGCSA